jgi:histidinol-phosphatase (PHP family)
VSWPTPTSPTGHPPAGRGLPLDGHLHTSRSHDSRVPIDAYGALAVEYGIAELAITDHVDFDPTLPGYRTDVRAREREVREAAERWAARGVEIRFGVEISYESAREDDIRDHLRRAGYDYAIGSVHVGPRSPYHRDAVATWVAGRGLPEVVEPYFDEVVAAARSGLFDTIGHLDFVKRYLMPHVGPAELAAAPELYERVLRALIEGGVALEVNTSGLRQVAGETYPAPWVVARYRELGGRHVVTGSDAHLEDHFASGLDVGYATIRDAGFGTLAFRRGGGRVSVDVPNGPGGESFTA